MYVENAYFKHKNVIKVYIVYNICGYKCKKSIDYVLVRRNVLRWVSDVKMVRVQKGVLFGHCFM